VDRLVADPARPDLRERGARRDPADPEEAPTKFVSQGAHYWSEVEARSTPPAGVSPGVAGVVIDGSADGRDIAAMILDLARRGWLQLAQVGGTDGADGDWAITRVDQPWTRPST
jgi:hypothetical protein